jgi:hypothetical protein
MDANAPYPQEPSRVRPFLPAEPEPGADRVNGAGPGAGSHRRPEVSSLRPYLLTGGRARPDANLEIEAQVVTTDRGHRAIDTLAYEQRDIVELCRQPTAVAEVAARLALHLGVVRVLVGDLLAVGHLAVRRPGAEADRDVEIIERVIRGLQAID